MSIEDSDVEALALRYQATDLVTTAMKQAGVTRSELAGRLGVSQPNVTQLLNGERNMTLDTLAKTLHAMDLRAELYLRPLREEPMDVASTDHPDHGEWLAAMDKDAKHLDRLRVLVEDRLTGEERLAEGNELEWSDQQYELDERDRDPAWAAWCYVTVARGDREGQGYCELSDARDLEGEALDTYLAEQADFLLEQAREELA